MQLYSKEELASLLTRHDMTFEKPAKQWEQGVFMGNGLIGTVVWDGMRDHPRPSRFHVGQMERIPKGKMLSHTMRLRLADAVTEGTTVTDRGSIHWRTWGQRRKS